MMIEDLEWNWEHGGVGCDLFVSSSKLGVEKWGEVGC